MTEANKRGPRRLTDDERMCLRQSFPDVHTDRQIQNQYFAYTAMVILGLVPSEIGQYPPPTWLVDWAAAERGKQGAVKLAILEQLGRMAYDGFPDDVIREQADEIEQWKPTVKVGAAYLRGLRRSVKPHLQNRRLPPTR